MCGLRQWGICVAMLVLVTGCATPGGKPGALSFLYTYEMALKDFERGRIMEARNIVLNMETSRADYALSQKLLREKIEPARLKLLKHYQRQGEQAQKAGQWWRAKKFYGQAAQFSLKPGEFEQVAKAMDVRLRQLRLDVLLRQRRREVAALLAWSNAYLPPKGMPGNDPVFARMREQYQDFLEDWASRDYIEAKRYLRYGYPEAAFVAIESHLRLRPDSSMGMKLRKDILQALPAGLKLPRQEETGAKSAARELPAGDVQAKDIKALINAGQLLKARALALAFQRQGGKGAERLLEDIDKRIAAAAAVAFQHGRTAFREERLDEAVRHWQRAAALRPDEPEYAENLERAEALQERLRLLRGSENQ